MKLFPTVAILVAFAWPAMAGYEFTQGKPIAITILGCDTLEQAQDIMESWEDGGWQGFVATKTRYNHTRNAFGQPKCGVVEGMMIPVELHSEHSVIGPSQKTIMAYLIHFIWGAFDLYAISPFPMFRGDPV